MSFYFNNVVKSLFNFQLQDYHEYIELMENSIDTHKQRLDQAIEDASKDIQDPEQIDEMIEYHYLDDYHNLNKTYPLILRKSIFITIHAFFESELHKVSKRLESEDHSKIKLNDINHRGIQKYVFYIETVHNINIDLSQTERNIFKSFNDLRNYLIHNDGINTTNKLHKRLKSLPYVTFEKHTENSYLIKSIEKGLNEGYLNLISDFFERFFTALSRHKFD